MQIDLAAIVGNADRDLIVDGLSALWRERVDAFNVAAAVAAPNPAPPRELFDIDAPKELLTRLGAAPSMQPF